MIDRMTLVEWRSLTAAASDQFQRIRLDKMTADAVINCDDDDDDVIMTDVLTSPDTATGTPSDYRRRQ